MKPAFCFLLILFHACVPCGRSEDGKSKPAESEAPSLDSVTPFVLTHGATATLTLRGRHLDDLQSLRLLGGPAPIDLKWSLQEPPASDKPAEKGKEKEKDKGKGTGEQILRVEVAISEGFPTGTNATVVASGPKGQSQPVRLFVVGKGLLVEEKEPNGGFKESQSVETGRSILGSLSQATDVDVFKLHMSAGQTLRAELFASQLGLSLDASLSVYDSGGSLLGSNDDAAGRDPAVTVKCSAGAEWFIAVSSVGEIPAKTTPGYVLRVGVEP